VTSFTFCRHNPAPGWGLIFFEYGCNLGRPNRVPYLITIMKNASSFLAGLVLGTGLLLSSGCAIIDAHSETTTSGTIVSDESLARVQPGSTTTAWLLATLGEPSSREQVDGSTEILKYSSQQLVEVDSELLFIFDTSTRKEVHRTVFFECVDGMLSRHWVEATE
jgi:hypothetical protein